MDLAAMLRKAAAAEGEELWNVLRLQHPDALAQAALNRNLTDGMAAYIARSRAASPELLGALSGDVRFRGSYRLRLELCRNPRTPMRIALAQLKFIKLFDLADLTRDRRVSVVVRQRVEVMVLDRIAGLALGVKAALSRRVSARLLEEIMNRGDRRVVETCLQSPRLTERQLYRLLIREITKPEVVRAIAEHPKWSLRYSIRYGLVRNAHTPMRRVAEFLRDLSGLDLKTLYADIHVPSVTKPFIFRELRDRGEGLELPEDVVYELEGHEDTHEECAWERTMAPVAEEAAEGPSEEAEAGECAGRQDRVGDGPEAGEDA